MQGELVSKIWRIYGIVSEVTPGLLVWNNRLVSFITEEGKEFEVPVSEIKNIRWPFLRMGLGFDAEVNGEKYKLSFTKPNPTARELDDNLAEQIFRYIDIGKFIDSIKTLSNLKADKATVRKWKEILGTKAWQASLILKFPGAVRLLIISPASLLAVQQV